MKLKLNAVEASAECKETIMNWLQYQTCALTTAIYPKEYALPYTALGLVDELYELYDAIGSDDEFGELSDCCWYVACFSHECRIPIMDTATLANELEDQFTFYDVFDAVQQARGAASRICGKVKKAIRDDHLRLKSDKKAKIQVELALIILSIYYICEKLGTTFAQVAEYNINKLASRQKRGKLMGSGNDR
jgi:NTP pyrophosphatase (non-canonical NTP hydrolase)